jgi:hypothetical protein
MSNSQPTRTSFGKFISENPLASRIVGGIVVAGVLSFCFYFFGGWDKVFSPSRKAANATPQKADIATPQKADIATPEEDSVSMAQFFAEYDQTPFAAIKRHRGKRVHWEGYFDGSAADTALWLKASPNSHRFIRCEFPDNAKEQLLTLKKGNKVTVSGILESESALKQCGILAIEEPGKQTKENEKVIEESSVTMHQFFTELGKEGATPFITFKRHLGKRVTWEGYFVYPFDEGSFVLSLTPDEPYQWRVVCHFPDDAKEQLLTLKRGNKVKVSGVLESENQMKHCKILAIEEAPAKSKEAAAKGKDPRVTK